MYVIIVGAGKVGYFLAKRMLLNKHVVSIVDKDRLLCEEVAKQLEAWKRRGPAAQMSWQRLPVTMKTT